MSPVARLTGHSRKVGQVLFNPAAANVLASASNDLSIKIWDITSGNASSAVFSLAHKDIVQSLSWSADGRLLVTTSRDKKIRVWDVRQERPAHEGAGHEGAKNSRVVWLGEHNRFATTGFSRMSDRQMALWEPGNYSPIGGFTTLDSISGVCMPFWGEWLCLFCFVFSSFIFIRLAFSYFYIFLLYLSLVLSSCLDKIIRDSTMLMLHLI